jgi:cytochrome c nitrite reductase small subunit
MAETRQQRRRVWHLALATVALLGIVTGVGTFTLGYADGLAYLRDDPAVCANCHVMQGHYDDWLKSSHRDVATCNSCHLGQGFVGRWVTKADNGFFHALAFTTDRFHRPIQIKPRNRRTTQAACLACHERTVNAMLPAHDGQGMAYCADCHSDVGHAGRRRGYADRQ